MQGNVRSIEALRDLRVATLELATRCGEVSFDIRSEVERALQWVTQEAPQYWRFQRKMAEQRFQEASDTLASMQATVGGRDKPACTELKQRVAKLKVRLRLCDEKLALCKRWATEIEHGGNDMLAAAATFQQQSESGLPLAAAKLQTWIAALDRYAEVQPLSPQGDSSGTSSESSSESPPPPLADK